MYTDPVWVQIQTYLAALTLRNSMKTEMRFFFFFIVAGSESIYGVRRI